MGNGNDRRQEIKSRFLQSCDLVESENKIEPFTFVIFGGSGDLARRKLIPSLLSLFESGSLPENFAVIGSGTKEFSDETYRESLLASFHEFNIQPETESWKKFTSSVYYHRGDVNSSDSYEELIEKLNSVTGKHKCDNNIIYYLAVPPSLYETIVTELGTSRIKECSYSGRIVIEKPFGTDKQSAAELNKLLHTYFPENQIYRIDHYLGKETVQNLIFFRFSNSILEPLWNYRYINNVQITAAESIGIGHRGRYYDRSGVVRDMVQNHLLQLVAITAMEVPVGFSADHVRNEKLKVFNSIRHFDTSSNSVVFGQYRGGKQNSETVLPYRGEAHVDAESVTPTFVALPFYIDNWRWAGVPFYVRTGKRMKRRVTDIVIEFTQPPLQLFGRTCDRIEPNILRFSIQPDEAITLSLGMKYPKSTTQIYPAEFTFNYKEAFNFTPHSTYERQLLDTMRGDLTLFAREDEIETMWDIVDPIVNCFNRQYCANFPNYDPGSWGPDGTSQLLEKNGHYWHTI